MSCPRERGLLPDRKGRQWRLNQAQSQKMNCAYEREIKIQQLTTSC
jgi:hypothetical protein